MHDIGRKVNETYHISSLFLKSVFANTIPLRSWRLSWKKAAMLFGLESAEQE